MLYLSHGTGACTGLSIIIITEILKLEGRRLRFRCPSCKKKGIPGPSGSGNDNKQVKFLSDLVSTTVAKLTSQISNLVSELKDLKGCIVTNASPVHFDPAELHRLV